MTQASPPEATPSDSSAQDPQPEEAAPATPLADAALHLRDWLVAALIAIALAVGIRSIAIEPFRIPSGSMFPTLLIGDHLFVNKFAYGARIPFSELRLPALREPERGDIVVFTVAKQRNRTFPADERPDLPREQFVKRLVGLPGDRIEFRDATVVINGEPLGRTPLGETFVDPGGLPLDVYEVTAGERTYRVLEDRGSIGPRGRALTVPPGRYFFMGDNRDHSQDSRSWGTVRREDIRGPAFLVYWSWDFGGPWRELARPGTWRTLLTEKMRWERIGAGL